MKVELHTGFRKKIETKITKPLHPRWFHSLVSPLCYPLSHSFSILLFRSGPIASVFQSTSHNHRPLVSAALIPPISPIIHSLLTNSSQKTRHISLSNHIIYSGMFKMLFYVKFHWGLLRCLVYKMVHFYSSSNHRF